MKKLNNEIYDAIIIGAGISGLVCGSYLSRAGLKVLIVEQHDKPGGYCTSFKRQGFSFDAAAHTLGGLREGANFRQIITELGIDTIIKITRYSPSDIVIMTDFKLSFWNDQNETIRELIDIFPKEAENIRNYYNYYRNLESANQFESAKLRDKTFGDFLSSYFSNKMLINAISYPVFGYAGLPPSSLHAFTGTKIYNEYLVDGGYYLEGGMQSLSNAFAKVIERHRGTLLYKRRANKILCTNNTVEGVELSDNQSFRSKYVISACDMTQTFKTMLGAAVVNRERMDKLERFIPSTSTFILYIGIDRPFAELPEPGTNIWFLADDDLDSLFNSIMKADANIFRGSYMFRVSPDRKTILAFCFAPFKSMEFWKENKKKIADELLSGVEKQIPNIREHIAYCDAATPHTLYRYTLNHQGANYGWAPQQSQLLEPDFRHISSIKGLYLTGHWTAQTHGIRGVAYLGYDTARTILKHTHS